MIFGVKVSRDETEIYGGKIGENHNRRRQFSEKFRTQSPTDTASQDIRMPRKQSAAAAEKEPAVQAETEVDSQPPKDQIIGGGSHKIRMVRSPESERG
jgi:hypothetical protein